MNLLVTGLIGYALKEIVVPLISDTADELQEKEKQVPESEVQNALLNQHPKEYFKSSLDNGKTSINIVANKLDLIAKGYSNIYENLS